MAQAVTLDPDLGLVPVAPDEALEEIRTRLDGFEPRRSQKQANLRSP